MQPIQVLDASFDLLPDSAIEARRAALLQQIRFLAAVPGVREWHDLAHAQVELCDLALAGDATARRRVTLSVRAAAASRQARGLAH